MNNLDTSLLCLEIRSVAVGYRVLKALTDIAGIKIIEASAAGGRFVLLATGESEILRDATHDLRGGIDATNTDLWLDQEVVEEYDQRILDALYSLPQVQAKEAVLIVECDSLSGLLAITQGLTHFQEVEIIELKNQRAAGRSYGLFTGPVSECGPAAEEARTKLRASMRNGRVELLEELSEGFRHYFNLSGKVD